MLLSTFHKLSRCFVFPGAVSKEPPRAARPRKSQDSPSSGGVLPFSQPPACDVSVQLIVAETIDHIYESYTV